MNTSTISLMQPALASANVINTKILNLRHLLHRHWLLYLLNMIVGGSLKWLAHGSRSPITFAVLRASLIGFLNYACSGCRCSGAYFCFLDFFIRYRKLTGTDWLLINPFASYYCLAVTALFSGCYWFCDFCVLIWKTI